MSISLEELVTGEVLVKRSNQPSFYPVSQREVLMMGEVVTITHFLRFGTYKIEAFWVFDKLAMWMKVDPDENDGVLDEDDWHPRAGEAIITNENLYAREISHLECREGNIRVFHNKPHILAAQYDMYRTIYSHVDEDGHLYSGLNIYDYGDDGAYCLSADGNIFDFESAMSLYMNTENFDLSHMGEIREVEYNKEKNRLEATLWKTCRHGISPIPIPQEIKDFARSLS